MTFENDLDEERGKAVQMFQGYSIWARLQGVKGCTSLGPSLPIIQAISRASRGRGMVSGSDFSGPSVGLTGIMMGENAAKMGEKGRRYDRITGICSEAWKKKAPLRAIPGETLNGVAFLPVPGPIPKT
jgi:hypothetical protein